MLRKIKKITKETPLIGRGINSFTSDNPEENAPSIQAVIDNMTQPQNLLINGDFKINQRGKSSYNALGFTLDNWYATSGRVTVTPLTGGGVRIYNSDNSNALGLMQNTGIKTDSFTPYTVVVEFVDGTVVTLQTNDTTQESSKITEDYAIKIRPSSGGTIRYDIQAYPLKTIEVKNARLYEGSIAYSNIEEDDAIALMRCSQYVHVIEARSPVGTGMLKDGKTFYVELKTNLKNLPTITFKGGTIILQEGHQTSVNNLSILSSYSSNGDLILVAKSSSGFYSNIVSGICVAIDRPIILSCEPL